MSQTRPVFLGGLRTSFGLAHKGRFKDVRPDDLLLKVVDESRKCHSELWQKTPTDFLVGCAYPEGEQGYNLARTVSLAAGLKTPGMTINRLCGSSLEALTVASAFVKSGRGDAFLVGGVESMSRVPRRGANFSESDAIKARAPNTYITMGETAERVAQKFSDISRSEQEDFACMSHERAAKAFADGFFADHVLGGSTLRDESVRSPIDRDKMKDLRPAFSETGVVTAATSSPMSDGAAVGFVMSEDFAAHSGAKDGLRILDVVCSDIEPELMGLGPIPAVQTLLQRGSIRRNEIVAVEMNEAFAIQALACAKQLEIPSSILNTKGGALAVGHPLGASGLRLMMTLHYRLRELGENNSKGIASLCIGGGQGMAVSVEYVKL